MASYHSGFSLIETGIVLMLLSALMCLGMHSFQEYDRLLLHNELNRLYMLCIAYSQRAALQQRPYEITFSSTNSQIINITEPSQEEIHHLTNGTQFGILTSVKGPPATPQNFITQPITFVGNKITFYPDGKIQPGTLYLTDTNKRWLYALSCSVGTLSYLRRYRYEQNKWILMA